LKNSKEAGKKSRFPLELHEMSNKGSRKSTDFVRHFFIGEFFAKCSAVHLRLNQCFKTGLRAKWQFLKSARKIQSEIMVCFPRHAPELECLTDVWLKKKCV
jgi:hypothetical protein